ncbi:thymidine kinase [Paenibacillus odorifer]|uniref:thymidine kinase n=1 Tax=Paenibacillus odorifer TaxID=189426 RepID=UPI002116EB46|nr:thymidine kinase [Paenibacillus odorifer]
MFRYGSMNASKSANLIMDWHNLKTNGKHVLAFKPTLDIRDYGYITSRAIETKIPAGLVTPDIDGIMYCMTKTFMPRTVLVDEVQFLTAKQIDELASIVDKLGVTVQAYGLMTNFKGELFEGSKRLVELADVVERIRSECTECSNEGLINARFVDGVLQTDGLEVVVGAEQLYKVLCRSCYSKMMKG